MGEVLAQPQFFIRGGNESTAHLVKEYNLRIHRFGAAVLCILQDPSIIEPKAIIDLADRPIQETPTEDLIELLLQTGKNGIFFDYDAPTWEEILKNETGLAARAALKATKAGDKEMEPRRRKIATTDQQIYIGRLLGYQQTQAVSQPSSENAAEDLELEIEQDSIQQTIEDVA